MCGLAAVACGGASDAPGAANTSPQAGGAGAPSAHAGAGGASAASGSSGSGDQAGAGGTSVAGGADNGGTGNAGDAAGGAAGIGMGGNGPDLGASAAYTCNLILGIQTTSEWFGKFEKIADADRWELMSQDSAHLEKWADPNHAVWSLAKKTPCTQDAESPERIVFMGVNYDYTTVEEFLPKYLAVIANIKAKYPTAKRVDVMTYTRGPNNQECKDADRPADSYIKPAQDEAISMLAAMFPDFVFPAPKWEVASCDDFTLCPHLTNTGNETLSAELAKYYDGK